MALGLGIVLVLIGLVVVLDVVSYDIPNVDDYALGWVLIIVGALAIVLTLVMGAIASRRARVDEHHYDHSHRA